MQITITLSDPRIHPRSGFHFREYEEYSEYSVVTINHSWSTFCNAEFYNFCREAGYNSKSLIENFLYHVSRILLDDYVYQTDKIWTIESSISFDYIPSEYKFQIDLHSINSPQDSNYVLRFHNATVISLVASDIIFINDIELLAQEFCQEVIHVLDREGRYTSRPLIYPSRSTFDLPSSWEWVTEQNSDRTEIINEQTKQISRTAEKKAQEIAEQLLFSFLTDSEIDLYKNHKFIYAVGEKTKTLYKITNWRQINIIVCNVNSSGEIQETKNKYCIVPKSSDQVPIADQMLAQKLMIESNESYFLEVAKEWNENFTERGTYLRRLDDIITYNLGV